MPKVKKEDVAKVEIMTVLWRWQIVEPKAYKQQIFVLIRQENVNHYMLFVMIKISGISGGLLTEAGRRVTYRGRHGRRLWGKKGWNLVAGNITW